MTILVVAAHLDDEVLGCGATVAKWIDAGNVVNVLIMAEGATSRDSVRDVSLKDKELSLLKRSANLAGEILGVSSVKILGFPDNRMDSIDLLDVVKVVESEIEQLQPKTVVTHHSGDLNLDHRVVHQAVMTACRPLPNHTVRRLLTFETPSSTEWQSPSLTTPFQPNWFEDVSKTIGRKIEALKVYHSEMREWPHARSLQSVEYLARLRGASVGCEAAEAFMLMREIK
jgi:N-acetylglucosamine malate deacetylase 1